MGEGVRGEGVKRQIRLRSAFTLSPHHLVTLSSSWAAGLSM